MQKGNVQPGSGGGPRGWRYCIKCHKAIKGERGQRKHNKKAHS